MKAQLAFYKGKGDITDKLIRWWTNSSYSHVELVMDGMWYSTSPRDLKVRVKRIAVMEGNWDFVEVEVDRDKVLEFYDRTKGSGYDWCGIVCNEVMRTKLHSKNKWYCSEWVASALGMNPSQVSPQELWESLNA